MCFLPCTAVLSSIFAFDDELPAAAALSAAARLPINLLFGCFAAEVASLCMSAMPSAPMFVASLSLSMIDWSLG